MRNAGWRALEAALTRAADGGVRTRVWLRDDDATAVTPALGRLAGATAAARLPLLLAVIPAPATPELAAWVEGQPLVTPCQHGLAHINHAAPGERACELGGDRPDAAVLEELARGRDRMGAMFGMRLAGVLVPPWNRIRASLVADLPGLGFSALSTFAANGASGSAPLPRLDCDLDIIDWRNGRQGRPLDDLCRRLVALVEARAASGDPIGILTHHLAHDDAAWAFVENLLPTLLDHPGVEATSAAREIARRAAGP